MSSLKVDIIMMLIMAVMGSNTLRNTADAGLPGIPDDEIFADNAVLLEIQRRHAEMGGIDGSSRVVGSPRGRDGIRQAAMQRTGGARMNVETPFGESIGRGAGRGLGRGYDINAGRGVGRGFEREYDINAGRGRFPTLDMHTGGHQSQVGRGTGRGRGQLSRENSRMLDVAAAGHGQGSRRERQGFGTDHRDFERGRTLNPPPNSENGKSRAGSMDTQAGMLDDPDVNEHFDDDSKGNTDDMTAPLI